MGAGGWGVLERYVGFASGLRDLPLCLLLGNRCRFLALLRDEDMIEHFEGFLVLDFKEQ